MDSTALCRIRFHGKHILLLFLVFLLVWEMILPVFADTAGLLSQWHVRHDPELSFSQDYDLLSIAYGKGRFVALGDCWNNNSYEPVLTSTDGTNWAAQASGVKGNSLNEVTFGDDKFVAVGLGGLILSSPDGQAWTIRNSYKSKESGLLSVTYGNNTFVASGINGTIWTSPDGELWTKSTKNLTYTISDIIYNEGTFVMVGDYGYIWTSEDGLNWAQQASGTSNSLYGIAYGGGRYTAVGISGTILTSADGKNWTKQISGISASLSDVCFGSGTFVAVGGGGTILSSADGEHWTLQNSGTTEGLSGIAYGNYTFCVVGGSTIFQSENLGPIMNGINPTNGPEAGGTMVTINGSNLSVVTAVYFGDTAALDLTLDTDTSICAISPPGTGTVQVTVWGSDGAAASSADSMFMYTSPTPSIGKQPLGQLVAEGQTAVFSVEAFGDAPLSFRWRKDGADIPAKDNLDGINEAVLTINDVQETDEGSYTCYISNDKGSITSNAASLTVVSEEEFPFGNWSDYVKAPDLNGYTYTIDSAEELAWLASEINKGHSLADYTFNVTADINLKMHYWTPIGLMDEYPFMGSFIGNGHSISGMTVGSAASPSTAEYNGLFGKSSGSAEISAVELKDVSVFACSDAYVGGLIGYNGGTIEDCHVDGTVEGGSDSVVGGLSGYCKGPICDSKADCSVIGGVDSAVGGFAGFCEEAIYNSGAKGDVSGDAGASTGGFIGEYYNMSGTIYNCYAAGNVTGGGASTDKDSYTGGFVAYNFSIISNCYATGSVTGGDASADYDSYIGGFAGYNYYNIKNCYASGNAAGGINSAVGGFIGINKYVNPVNSYWNSSAVQKIGDVPRQSEELRGIGQSSNGTDKTCGLSAAVMKGAAPDTGISYTSLEGTVTTDTDAEAFTDALNGGASCLGTGLEYLSWVSDRSNTNGGYPIFITDITSPSINPAVVSYIVNCPGDVSTQITWNNAQKVTDVVYSSDSLTAGTDYTLNDNNLTIKKDYLSSLNLALNDTADFEIFFDLGDSAALSVTASVYSEDASLKQLKVGDLTVTDFVYDNYSYTIQLPYGTQPGSAAAIVEAVPADPNAKVNITQATSLPGDAVVNVTAEDGMTKSTYTVHLTLGDEPNTAPAAKNPIPAQKVETGNSVGFTAADIAEDADGDPLVITKIKAVPSPEIAGIELSNGTVVITGKAAGNTSVTVAVSDGKLDTDLSVPITVIDSQAPSFALTITAGAGGSITAGSSGSYGEGTVIGLAASANDGYSFDRWTSNGGGSFAAIGSPVTSFTMPACPVTITANFILNSSGENGGSGNGGKHRSHGSGSAAAAPSTYRALVSGGSIAQSYLPVAFTSNTGSAAIDLGALSSTSFKAGEQVSITAPAIPGAGSYSIGFPGAAAANPEGKGTIVFSTELGSLRIPGNMLAEMPAMAGVQAGISIIEADRSVLSDEARAAIGDRPLLQLALTLDGEPTEWNNPDAPVTVTIPYRPTEAELADPESIIVWYIDGSGNMICVPNGHYDEVSGTVTFTTTHFSYYAVGFRKMSFNDVPAGSWYKKAVSFIAARGITTGTENKSYSPEATVKRGEFLVMLLRAYGIEPDAAPKTNFADAGRTYYTNYLAAAKRLGISEGIGSNRFAPEKKITRQEASLLLYNMLKKLEQLPDESAGRRLADFIDAGQAAPWAKDALEFLIKAGVLNGKSGRISPADGITRAEMAQVLYNLIPSAEGK